MGQHQVGPTLAQDDETAQRSAVALDVLRRGFRGQRAADEMTRLGHKANRKTWHRLCQMAIKRVWVPAAEEAKKLELERLDENHKRLEAIIQAHLPDATSPGFVRVDEETGQAEVVIPYEAIRAVLESIREQTTIAARRAKHLGLDEAEKHEVSVGPGILLPPERPDADAAPPRLEAESGATNGVSGPDH